MEHVSGFIILFIFFLDLRKIRFVRKILVICAHSICILLGLKGLLKIVVAMDN